MAHPPLLYLGYVGLTVPFAFAIGALLARRTDELWIVATRRWTLIAWTALGIGQLLGAHWAYEEVGWGGYYAWDPVENAALMPWLAATAFLHSVMIQEKRGMLKVWNVLLVLLAFSLSLFGTFLTRSGIVSSIHAFTEGSLGPWFLGFTPGRRGVARARVLASAAAPRPHPARVARLARGHVPLQQPAPGRAHVDDPLGRHVSDSPRGGVRRAADPRRGYYNFFLRAFGLPLLLLMGIGPLVAWRRASLRSLGASFAWPAGVALAVGLILLALGAGSSTPGLIAYTFSAFVLASIVYEFARGTRARHALAGGTWPRAFSDLVARNRRRYGGYIVHAAVVLFAIGVAGSSAYDTVSEGRLARGETIEAGDYRLTFGALQERAGPNATEVRAVMTVERDGDRLGTLAAGKNAYTAERLVSNEVGIRSDPLTGEDLFLIAEQLDPDGTVYVRVFVKPLVNLIWVAGLIFLLGSLITLWPDAREQRRLAVRYARAGVGSTEPA